MDFYRAILWKISHLHCASIGIEVLSNKFYVCNVFNYWSATACVKTHWGLDHSSQGTLPRQAICFNGGPPCNTAPVVEIFKLGGKNMGNQKVWPNTARGEVLQYDVLFSSHSEMARASKIWRGEVLGCKSIPATFPICPNWLWGVIHCWPGHTQSKQTKEDKENWKTFPFLCIIDLASFRLQRSTSNM